MNRAATATTAPASHARPGRLEKIGYGLGGAANNVIWTGISTFLVFFYTDVLGVAAGVIGTVMLFSRILDGISDVVAGILIDRTRSRHGKARPWLLWLAVPFAIAAVLLFTVPDTDATTTLIYIAVTYNLALLIYTAVEIPHGTLGALITEDQHQRSILNVAKMTGAYIAIIAISNVTVPLVDLLGGGQRGWIGTFVLYGLLAAAIYFVTFASTTERAGDGGERGDDPSPSVATSLRALLRNKYWALVTALLLLMYVYNAITSGVAIYYATYILDSSALVGTVITALTIATLAGMAVVLPITRRYGKRNTALVGCLLAVVGSVVIMLAPGDIAVVIAGQVLRGLGKATVMGVVFAMLADTMEYGEWKTRVRTEALIYSGASMGIKIGTGIGSALIGWGLALAGYVGGAEQQSPAATAMISDLFIWLPAVVSVLMFVVLVFYRLERDYSRILGELEARAAGGAA